MKNKDTLIENVAAAKELRRVPGFDPLKFLRRATSATGEKVMKLDLAYKKLWFRLACPNGRTLLNPLRITDQMAIIEARLYASKDDPMPIANFTSTQMAKDVPGGLYIRAAQDDALNEALDNAGFGIQLCDVIQVSDGSGRGSEIPLSQIDAAAKSGAPVGVPDEVPREKAAIAQPTPNEAPQQAGGQMAPQAAVVAAAPEAAAEPGAAVTEDTVPPSDGETTASCIQTVEEVPAGREIQEQPQEHEVTASGKEFPVESDREQEAAAGEQTGYTEDMPVEEICRRMSLEEAKTVVVPMGTCKGWTLGQVAASRPSSLKWYVYGCKDAGNILKAGASLLLNDLELKKAG